MNKFPLFLKSTETYWSVNKKIYSIIFICLGILFFEKEFLLLEKTFIDKVIMAVMAITMIYAFYSKIIGLSLVEPLRGVLNGYLIFENKYIQAGEEIYNLEMIRKIQISNNDYLGKLAHISRGNFGPALSNGTNNYIILFLESGKTKRFQFQMSDSNDFQNVRKILIEYYLHKKIDFWEIANILGENSTSEIADFTKEIDAASTAANSQ